MIDRFDNQGIGGNMHRLKSFQPTVDDPSLERKKRAQIRREILTKLKAQMKILGISNEPDPD